MKKLISIILILGIILIPFVAFGAGTVTQTIKAAISGVQIVTISWTGDASDGTVPSTVLIADIIGAIEGYYFYSAETNPDAGPPTANYDIVLNDADGIDIAGGLLMNRHTTTSELVNIGNSAFGYPVIRNALTFVLTNNSQTSATGTLILTFIR